MLLGLGFVSLQQLPIAMEKAGENQQREAKGCSEASQEGNTTNR